MKATLLLAILLFPVFAFAQIGTLEGTIEDASGPLPGVNVLIKGTSTGTQTDFDGNYSIQCQVGDIIQYSYIGFKTKEFVVTDKILSAQRMKEEQKLTLIRKIPVQKITTLDYGNRLRKTDTKSYFQPEDQKSLPVKTRGRGPRHAFKNIEVDSNRVLFKKSPYNTYKYNIAYHGNTQIRYVKESNLPDLQTTFAQGISVDGSTSWQGPETGIPFSFGPKLSSLAFNSQSYPYDLNGQLVPVSEINTTPANPYSNRLFRSSLKNEHNIALELRKADGFLLQWNAKFSTNSDIYGVTNRSTFSSNLNYSFRLNSDVSMNLDLIHLNDKNRQPKLNGFQNLLLLNQYITPPSFDNHQGFRLPDGSPRSFAPGLFNNPLGLLAENENRASHSLSTFNATGQWDINTGLQLSFGGYLTSSDTAQDFDIPETTAGFLDGNRSSKKLNHKKLGAILILDNYFEMYLWDDIEVHTLSKFEGTFTNLDYSFKEVLGSNTLSRKLNPKRDSFQFINKASFTFDAPTEIILRLGNASYTSSIQENSLWQPNIEVYSRIHTLIEALDFDFIKHWSLSAGYSETASEPQLFYANTSHNSLNILPENSLSYTANNDLFIDNGLGLERTKRLEIQNSMRLFRGAGLRFDINYFKEFTQGAVFPILENSTFSLTNTADIRNEGFEAEITFDPYHYFNRKFSWSSSAVFSKNRTKVHKLLSPLARIPIAGFSNISQNLVVGQPAGVIVGSAYDKNDQGQKIIGSDGFPLVVSQAQIIGDPTPDFNLGLTNTFNYGRRWLLQFTLDWQQGGDIWNGTQQVLNYFGASQETALKRSTENFVFNGVTQNGSSNTQAVNFYNLNQDVTQNRWTRYGFSGVGEEAIIDGSYLNLKSIALSFRCIGQYEYSSLKEKKGIVKDLQITIYANNLFTWSKYRGAVPYTSLFDGNNGQALNFFNSPLVSETGLKVSLKI